MEAQACYSLGNTYTLLQDYERAAEYHLRHLLIAQELADRCAPRAPGGPQQPALPLTTRGPPGSAFLPPGGTGEPLGAGWLGPSPWPAVRLEQHPPPCRPLSTSVCTSVSGEMDQRTKPLSAQPRVGLGDSGYSQKARSPQARDPGGWRRGGVS